LRIDKKMRCVLPQRNRPLEAPAPGSASALAIVGVDATLDQPAALHAATNAFAARPTSAAVIPGLYSAEPIPKPPAPALR